MIVFGTITGFILEMFVFKDHGKAMNILLILNPLPFCHIIKELFDGCNEFHCPGLSDLYWNSNMFYGFIAIWVNAVLYFVAGWYLDQVLPQPGGIRKSWYFPVEFLWKWLSRRFKKENYSINNDIDENEDDDVMAERKAVFSLDVTPDEYPVLIKNLRKQYGNFVAVHSLCLSIRNNECFG